LPDGMSAMEDNLYYLWTVKTKWCGTFIWDLVAGFEEAPKKYNVSWPMCFTLGRLAV